MDLDMESHVFQWFLNCFIVIQRRNYQVSKEIVHELKFGDIAVMQI